MDVSAGRTYYDYESRNLVTRIDFPGSVSTSYFEYNAVGERVRKTDGEGVKKYTWDGLVPILEKNVSNATVQRMVKGYTPIAGIGEFAVQDVSGTVLYPHKNHVGTTNYASSGDEANQSEYQTDAWGVDLGINDNAGTQRYIFTGKELDRDFTSLNSNNQRYHFPARFYLPFRGLFGQVDPLDGTVELISQFLRSPEKYVCSHGNPTRFVDPAGMQAVTLGKTCKPGEWACPRPNHKPTTNGCGDDSWKGRMVPNKPGGVVDFTEACNKHDICYETCGKSKAQCDKEFLDNMGGACALKYGLMMVGDPKDPQYATAVAKSQAQVTACEQFANAYYKGVRGETGDRAYNESQEKACNCCGLQISARSECAIYLPIHVRIYSYRGPKAGDDDPTRPKGRPSGGHSPD